MKLTLASALFLLSSISDATPTHAGQMVLQDLSRRWNLQVIAPSDDLTDEMVFEFAAKFKTLQNLKTLRESGISQVYLVARGTPRVFNSTIRLPYSIQSLDEIEAGEVFDSERVDFVMSSMKLEMIKSQLGLAGLTGATSLDDSEISEALKVLYSFGPEHFRTLGVNAVMIVPGIRKDDISEVTEGILIFPSTAQSIFFAAPEPRLAPELKAANELPKILLDSKGTMSIFEKLRRLIVEMATACGQILFK